MAKLKGKHVGGQELSIKTKSAPDTFNLAKRLAKKISGKELIVLIGDLGCGKTLFVRGLVQSLGSRDKVQSPSFTISRVYRTKNFEVHHYDFHRLNEPGIVADSLKESVDRAKVITIIEWPEIIKNVLPQDRLEINFVIKGKNIRELFFSASGKKHTSLLKGLK